eukprot:EG_transcript_3225
MDEDGAPPDGAAAAEPEEVKAEEGVKKRPLKKKKKRVKSDGEGGEGGGEEAGAGLSEGQSDPDGDSAPSEAPGPGNGGREPAPVLPPYAGAASLGSPQPQRPPPPTASPQSTSPRSPEEPLAAAGVEGDELPTAAMGDAASEEPTTAPAALDSPPAIVALAEPGNDSPGAPPEAAAEGDPAEVAKPRRPRRSLARDTLCPEEGDGTAEGKTPKARTRRKKSSAGADGAASAGGDNVPADISGPPGLTAQEVAALQAEVEALRAQALRLPKWEQELLAWEAGLKAREQAFRQRQEKAERDIRDREAELAALTQQAMDRRRAVEEQELALECLQQELADLQAKEEALALREARQTMKEAELARAIELTKQNEKAAEAQRALWMERVTQLQDTEKRLADREGRVGQREELLAGAEQWLHARDVELVAKEIDAIRHGRFTVMDGLQRAANPGGNSPGAPSPKSLDAPRPWNDGAPVPTSASQPDLPASPHPSHPSPPYSSGPPEPNNGREESRLMEREQLVEARERHLLGLLAETERRGAELSRREKALTERELALRAGERAHDAAVQKHTERERSLADAERSAALQKVGLASAEADVVARARQLERKSHFLQTKADIRLLLSQPMADDGGPARASPTGMGGLLRSRPHTASPVPRHTVEAMRPYSAGTVLGKDRGLVRLTAAAREAAEAQADRYGGA